MEDAQLFLNITNCVFMEAHANYMASCKHVEGTLSRLCAWQWSLPTFCPFWCFVMDETSLSTNDSVMKTLLWRLCWRKDAQFNQFLYFILSMMSTSLSTCTTMASVYSMVRFGCHPICHHFQDSGAMSYAHFNMCWDLLSANRSNLPFVGLKMTQSNLVT